MKLRFFISVLMILGLVSCSYFHPYRPNIQQGNIVSQRKVDQLHIGMSRAEVIKIMGDPVLTDTFSHQRLVYVYTYWPNYGPYVEKRATLTFRNNRLTGINKSLPKNPARY